MKAEMRYPDFFVVGAPKAATTSLYHYLAQHPAIFVPEIKEPHFFSCPEVTDTYYNVKFVEDEQAYTALYSQVISGQIAGDFSPSYLFREKAATRIHSRCPDARIIIVLRNPVDRAISHYLMDVRAGYQSAELLEVLRHQDKYRVFYREYVEVGFYADQVGRYLSRFGNDRVLVILYDDIKNNIKDCLSQILHHLSLPPGFEFDCTIPRNAHRTYRLSVFRKAMNLPFSNLVSQLAPAPIKRCLLNLGMTTKKPSFDKEKILLKNTFKEDIRNLEEIIGRDLSAWLS